MIEEEYLPKVNIQVNIRCGNCPDHSEEYTTFPDGESGFYTHYCNIYGRKTCLHSSDKILSITCPRAKKAVELALKQFCSEINGCD